MHRSRFSALTLATIGIFQVSLIFAQSPLPSDWRPNKAHLQAAEHITTASLNAHIRFLSHDLLEGRGPGSRGDKLAQLYVATQFESIGLQPGAGQGEWYQSVPLVGVTTQAPATVQFEQGAKSITLRHHNDMMLTSGQLSPSVSVKDAELVFVGYGIQAPEYQWDDFKDVNVQGKILVIMNNDPQDDPQLFAGRRRLYYGRWDYKYDMAAKKGAAGALIIHTTESAGYPYQVVQTSWSGESFELASSLGPRTNIRGWVTDESAQKLFTLAGHDLTALRKSAQSRDFKPVQLGITMSAELTNTVRQQATGNVIGILPGSDSQLAPEHVIFMAHHDHLGMAAARDAKGDDIYNGAIDNASGTASLLTIARAISGLPERPKRSIMFAAVGAEEQGLLGSKYLADHPPIAAGAMAAVINIDGINFLGKTHDLNLIGNGKSSLDGWVEAVAKFQGRTVVPDYFPDRGYYYRSDQFSLAKIGVPGVYLHSGINVVGKPDGWGKAQLEEWVEKTYHQPGDEFQDNWDLAGAIDDVRLLMEVGLQVADQSELPVWNPGDEFEAARNQALSTRQP